MVKMDTQLFFTIVHAVRPSIGDGPDGDMVLYCWDMGDHHVELEVCAHAPPAWFYRNRRTGELCEPWMAVNDGE